MCIAAAIAGSAAVGAVATNKASKAQSRSADKSITAQQDQFARQTELQEPFRQGGLAAQNRLLTLLGIAPQGEAEGLSVNQGSPDFGRYGRDFGMQDFQQDPGYSFRLKQGLQALDRQAAARGGLISGSALKAAQNYGQEAASNEYQNAFNRYQVNRSNQLNPLQSLMGQGQSATNALGQAGQSMANNMGEAYMGAGNARASGYMGMANALSGGVGQYVNYSQNQNFMNMLNQNRGYGNVTNVSNTMPTYGTSYGE